MLFNEVKKSAVKMAKSYTLILVKKDDYYWISNSHWLVKVHETVYDTAFRIASPRFIPLENGEGASIVNDKKNIPVKGDPFDIERLKPTGNIDTVTVTPFIHDDGKTARIIDNNGVFMGISEEYYQLLKPFITGNLQGISGEACRPIFTDWYDDVTVMIMPYRITTGDYEIREVA